MRSDLSFETACWKLIFATLLIWASGTLAASAQLNPQQIQLIRDTAAGICNTIKDAKGKQSDVKIEGEVKAKVGGLIGKLADAGIAGSGSLQTEEFEGISREATASALFDDRACRERVFNKMFDKLSSAPSDTITATYVVCVGEHASSCPQKSVHLSCGSSVGAWAKQECQTFSETKLSDVPGNRCGYYTAQVTCVRSATR